MKEQLPEDIMADDIATASGKTVLDPAAMMDRSAKYETMTSTIQTAFRRQLDAAAGPWEQYYFEDILAKWIVPLPMLIECLLGPLWPFGLLGVGAIYPEGPL